MSKLQVKEMQLKVRAKGIGLRGCNFLKPVFPGAQKVKGITAIVSHSAEYTIGLRSSLPGI